MKKYSSILIFACITLSLKAQIFRGGNADGHANIRVTNAVCSPTGGNMFVGGNADGHANVRRTNAVCAGTGSNIYAGGNADGHANLRVTNAVCSSTGNNMFAGGDADGHANIRVTNVTCSVSNIDIFTGGDADGHANIRVTRVVCPVLNNEIFAGGDADGHANIRVTRIVCAVINNDPFIGGNAEGSDYGKATNVTPAQCISIVLPIELVYFGAVLNGNLVDAKWTTESEINSDFFTVEKTVDNINFEKVAVVKAAGNSDATINYVVVDKNPYVGLSYYRLTETDFDGKTQTFPLAPILYEIEGNASIAPIPAQNKIDVTYSKDITSLEVYNGLGQLIFKYPVQQNNRVTLDISMLNSGVYQMKFVGAKNVVTKKFIKVD